MKELTYTIESHIIIDVEDMADRLSDCLEHIWDGLGIEYEERAAIDKTEVLKEIAKHWLRTL